MISEVTALVALTGGAAVALMQGRRHPVGLRRLVCIIVTAGLGNFAVLGVTGFMQQGDGFLALLHAVAGHAMLPLIAAAIGLWLGVSLCGMPRRPLGAFIRLLYLLILGFFCLSNTWTGYAGPSRIDPEIDPETNLRFVILHQGGVPLLIGTLLLIWLLRLVFSQGAFAIEKAPLVKPITN